MSKSFVARVLELKYFDHTIPELYKTAANGDIKEIEHFIDNPSWYDVYNIDKLDRTPIFCDLIDISLKIEDYYYTPTYEGYTVEKIYIDINYGYADYF